MKQCYECGKELGFLEEHYHPALGKPIIVCWNCYERLDISMEQYRNFILNEFNHKEPEKYVKKVIMKSKSHLVQKNNKKWELGDIKKNDYERNS